MLSLNINIMQKYKSTNGVFKLLVNNWNKNNESAHSLDSS